VHLMGLAIILIEVAAPLDVAHAQPTILSAVQEPGDAMVIEVVPLTYSRAGELAYTLSLVAPTRVRIVPYYPTNSLIISGPRTSVEQLINIIKPPKRD
jgi:type II secretory pathway component GspD/PulD (secretin)